MRAITVRQPWAWAIVHGGKDVENRSRNIAGSYRGPVAIHAGLKLDGAAVLDRQIAREAGYGSDWRPWVEALDFGAIIGVADLVDVHQCSLNLGCYYPADVLGWVPALGIDHEYETCSEWGMAGHHHLVFANPRALTTPIPAKGRLGLWTLSDDLAAQVTESVAA